MVLSYEENEDLYLCMVMVSDGNCQIRLCEKIKNEEKECEYGRRVYTHTCYENTKKEDFNIYYEIEKLMKEKDYKNKIEKYLKIELS